MNYYNPVTKERITHRQLCDKFNASIPSNLEVYEDWYKLEHATRPSVQGYQTIKQNTDPELIDDKWTITYSIEELSIDTIRTKKMNELNNKFKQISESAAVVSSLGFTINADDTADRNIRGLITTLEDTGIESTQFCDYENNFHDVTLKDLKVMRLEIIRNGQALYQQKWAYRDQINLLTDIAELYNLEIVFTNLSFNESAE